MKSKQILGLAFLVMIMFTTIPLAFAGCGPGRTPGYWQAQLKFYLRGKTTGELKDIEDLLDKIPPNSWIPAGTYEQRAQWAYDGIHTGSNADGHKTLIANYFNTAFGYSPV